MYTMRGLMGEMINIGTAWCPILIYIFIYLHIKIVVKLNLKMDSNRIKYTYICSSINSMQWYNPILFQIHFDNFKKKLSKLTRVLIKSITHRIKITDRERSNKSGIPLKGYQGKLGHSWWFNDHTLVVSSILYKKIIVFFPYFRK